MTRRDRTGFYDLEHDSRMRFIASLLGFLLDTEKLQDFSRVKRWYLSSFLQCSACNTKCCSLFHPPSFLSPSFTHKVGWFGDTCSQHELKYHLRKGMKGKQNKNLQRAHFQLQRFTHSTLLTHLFSFVLLFSKKIVVLPSHTYQSTCLLCFRTKTLTNFLSPTFVQLWIISSVTTLFSSIFIQVRQWREAKYPLPLTHSRKFMSTI